MSTEAHNYLRSVRRRRRRQFWSDVGLGVATVLGFLLAASMWAFVWFCIVTANINL